MVVLHDRTMKRRNPLVPALAVLSGLIQLPVAARAQAPTDSVPTVLAVSTANGFRFEPVNVTAAGDGRVRVCNRSKVFSRLFSLSKGNVFGGRKGVELRPGECTTLELVGSSTGATRVAIGDYIHSRARIIVNVPSSVAEPVKTTTTVTTSTTVGCAAAGTWVHQTTDIGSTTWTIASGGIAQETGIGNATGQAALSGRSLTITFVASDRVTTGVYTWNLAEGCRSGTGSLQFTGPPTRAGATHTSTVTRIGS